MKINIADLPHVHFQVLGSTKKLLYILLTVGSGDSSPDRDAGKLGTSPHINKFLAREPPDGCEKVNLKFVEDNRYVSSFCQLKFKNIF